MATKYVMVYLDRGNYVTSSVHETRSAAFRKAKRFKTCKDVEVREVRDDDVVARWRIDPASDEFVPYSERAEIERRIEAKEADIRRRRAVLRTVDAVIVALRSLGIDGAQSDPDQPNGFGETEWSWHGASMRVDLTTGHYTESVEERAPIDEVKWTIRTWDSTRNFSEENKIGVTRVDGGTVTFSEEFIAAIKRCKRSL